MTAIIEEFPPELIARIFKFLTITEQIKIGTLRREFRANLPIKVDLNQPLVNVQNVPAFGFYSWRPSGLRLDMPGRDGRHRPSHIWVDAEIPLDAHMAPSIFFRFIMQELRPNGGYCSLLLSRPVGDPGLLELKFYGNSLRGYGGEVTDEDLGFLFPQSIKEDGCIFGHNLIGKPRQSACL